MSLTTFRRNRFCSFDLIDFADPAEIIALRARNRLQTHGFVHWTQDYPDDIPASQPLYAKGKRRQWDAELDIDWTLPVDPNEWLLRPDASSLAAALRLKRASEASQKQGAFLELRFLLSQLLHGEQAALMISGQLAASCASLPDKCFAATQTADEARHVEVLSRFLKLKMGGLDPIAPTTKAVLDALLSADSPDKHLLGMQVLFEGIALGLFAHLRSALNNELLASILRRVEQDEARHSAFGVALLRRSITSERREELEEYSFQVLEALNANQSLDMLRFIGPQFGLDPLRLLRLWLRAPNFSERNSPVYTHTVIPNLQALGLISERTRERYRARGIMT